VQSDVLAYFDRPGTSNGPTEAINGRLECCATFGMSVRASLLVSVLG
jgi:hypothetical protein